MTTLKVFFKSHDINYEGTAVLHENLITNECKLELDSGLFMDEIGTFINTAVEILKKTI